MSIITISRGSYSHGKAVAEKVAENLGYRCVSREIALEASREFNIPEIMLIRTMGDPPSVFDRLTYGREKYIAYVQRALIQHAKHDNLVYHGLAGHFFFPNVAHVLKVRIIADLEYRIAVVMQRDKVTRDEALRVLTKDDEERHNWSRKLFGIDQSDASLYDLVLHIDRISVDNAVDIICDVAGLEAFRTTPESQKAMDDLVICTDVRARIAADRSVGTAELEVEADDGVITVYGTVDTLAKSDKIKEIIRTTDGVKDVVSRMRIHSPW